MLKLFLIRHGEAQAASVGEPDHSRPLTARGKSDIEQLRARLFSDKSEALQIVCSTALRTVSTASLIGGGNMVAVQEADLYNGDAAVYLNVIIRHSQADWLVVVGHNPVISWISTRLTNGLTGGFMPGSCVEINYHIPVSDPSEAKPDAVFTYHPLR